MACQKAGRRRAGERKRLFTGDFPSFLVDLILKCDNVQEARAVPRAGRRSPRTTQLIGQLCGLLQPP